MKGNKVQSLETLRGLACFLLVLNHLIGMPVIAGLRLPEGNGYFLFNTMLENVRMPLFAFLSGIIFSFRGIVPSQFNMLMKGKFFRLLVPLITLGPLYLIIQANAPGANQTVEVTSYFYYISVLWESKFHFWFLQAMFLIFLLYGLMSFLKFSLRTAYVLLLLAGGLLSLLMPQNITFFSLSGFFFLLPYFALGTLLGSFETHDEKLNPLVLIVLAFLFISLLIFKYFCIKNGSPFIRTSIFGLLIGFVGCSFFYFTKIKCRTLVYIGSFSFTIYLYHLYFLVLSRVLLNYFGVQNTIVSVSSGLLFGLFGPMVLEYFLSKNKLMSMLFLGIKFKNKNLATS
ncbi:acyltransferase [Pseudoalteromonas sp. SiA1]|uniref:acyltransferase family protein n=1 Tax=Pseudoalteromonas sp. SiA1 TaxID=2839744 RepID=UPI001C0038FD|nr:acyltransferase [Pseudoalteromonas sp. SiA1]QWF33921.1 acyltransferase [Pseudoalteromonas sp. SiA1]